MKRSGFTIIEFAVVLIVIGIIIAMALKGKDLIDIAKIRSDLSKIHKIEAAANIYFAKTGRIPILSPMEPDNTQMLDMGVISERDVTLEILGIEHSASGKMLNRIYLVGCVESPYIDDPSARGWAWTYAADGSAEQTFNACILVGEQEVKFPLSTVIRTGVSHFMVCHAETTLDDMNDRTGHGRQSASTPGPATHERLLDYSDCSALRRTENKESWYYRII